MFIEVAAEAFQYFNNLDSADFNLQNLPLIF